MAGICCVGDVCAAHVNCPQTAIATGSSTVKIGGKAVARQGDSFLSHQDTGTGTTHVLTITGASGTVRIEGKPVCKLGDLVSNGAAMITASASVGVG